MHIDPWDVPGGGGGGVGSRIIESGSVALGNGKTDANKFRCKTVQSK